MKPATGRGLAHASRDGYLPVMLGLSGRKILVVGGGRVAWQKVKMLLQFTRNITVVAPEILPEIRRAGVRPVRQNFAPRHLRYAGLVYACTNDRRVNALIMKTANQQGIMVNVADDPAKCDFITPAIFREGEMTVAVSSGGKNLDKTIRWRDQIRESLGSSGTGVRPVNNSRPGRKKRGKVFLVGATTAEHLTLRANQILRDADIIYYDDLLDEKLMDKYPGEKVYVGKRRGRHSTRQDDINGMLYRSARAGKSVVRLKCGDPLIFSRGGEELRHLRERSIEVEVVPGISSAQIAAASTLIPLTLRGVANKLVFLSGHNLETGINETLVYFMAASRLKEIGASLLEKGASGSTPAAIIRDAGMPTERIIISSVGRIGKVRINSPVVLIIGEVVRQYRVRANRG